MIASTTNPPQTTQAQGGNPLLPFLGTAQSNVSGTLIDPNGPQIGGVSGPGMPGPTDTGPGGQTPAGGFPQFSLFGGLSASVPGAPGDPGGAQSGGGSGYGFGGGLMSPFMPYSPIGNPMARDPRKKMPGFTPVGMQGATTQPAGGLGGTGRVLG